MRARGIMKHSAISMLWHAFVSLKDNPSDDYVSKSKIKGLTLHISIDDAQKSLISDFEAHFSDDVKVIGFAKYVNFLYDNYFLKHENFKALTTPTDLKSCRGKSSSSSSNHQHDCSTFYVEYNALEAMWHQLDHSCWEVFRNSFRSKMSSCLTDDTIYNLWLLFNTFCEQKEDFENDSISIMLPPVIDAEEAMFWFKKIGSLLSREIEEDQSIQYLDFFEFVNLLAEHMQEEYPLNLQSAVEALAASVINGVLASGYLQPLSLNSKEKRLNKAARWKPRWCVLAYNNFIMMNEDGTPDLKVKIDIKDVLKVQSVANQANQYNGFEIICFDNELYFEAADCCSKMFWLRAFRQAIESVQVLHCDFESHSFEKRSTKRRIARELAAEQKRQDLSQKEQEKMTRDKAETELKSRIAQLTSQYNDKVNELCEMKIAWETSNAAQLQKYTTIKQLLLHSQEDSNQMRQVHDLNEKELKCRIAQLEMELNAKINELGELNLAMTACNENKSIQIAQLENQIQQQECCIACEIEKKNGFEKMFAEEQNAHKMTKTLVNEKSAECEIFSTKLSGTEQSLRETQTLLDAEILKRVTVEEQMSKLRVEDADKQERIKLLTVKDSENQKIIRELNTNKVQPSGSHRGPGFLPADTE